MKRSLAGYFSAFKARTIKAPQSKVTMKLAPREEQVLRLVAEGLSATEIAAQLGVSPKTVETHRMRGYQKLGLSRRTLTRYALRAGWLAAQSPTSGATP